MHDPLISIIIRNYNRSLLKTVIPNLRNQGFDWIRQKCELIILDNCSDSFIDYGNYEWLAKAFPDNYLYHQFSENKGVVHSTNWGIQHAAGEWIAFCDTDDYWEIGYLRKQLDLINSFEGTNRFPGFSVVKSATLTNKPPENLLSYLVNNPWITTMSGVLFEKNLLDVLLEVNGFYQDPSFPICHDRDMYIRLLIEGDSDYCYLDDSALPAPLVTRKQQPDSITRKPENQKLWAQDRKRIAEKYKHYAV